MLGHFLWRFLCKNVILSLNLTDVSMDVVQRNLKERYYARYPAFLCKNELAVLACSLANQSQLTDLLRLRFTLWMISIGQTLPHFYLMTSYGKLQVISEGTEEALTLWRSCPGLRVSLTVTDIVETKPEVWKRNGQSFYIFSAARICCHCLPYHVFKLQSSPKCLVVEICTASVMEQSYMLRNSTWKDN